MRKPPILKKDFLFSHEHTREFKLALELQALVKQFPEIRGTGEQRNALRRAVQRIAHALSDVELADTREEKQRPSRIVGHWCRKAVVSLVLLRREGLGSAAQHVRARSLMVEICRILGLMNARKSEWEDVDVSGPPGYHRLLLPPRRSESCADEEAPPPRTSLKEDPGPRPS